MPYSLKLITAPAIEPVTTAEVKLHARISHDVEDSILAKWIKAARLEAESFQRRAYIGQIWELGFDNFPTTLPIQMPRAPLLQLISIKCYDYADAETVLYYEGWNPITTTEEGGSEPSTNSDFIIDKSSEPGRVTLAYGAIWPSITPRSIDSLKIRYAAGYGIDADDVPENVWDAIILYCTWRNDNRAAETDFPKQFYDLLSQDRLFLL